MPQEYNDDDVKIAPTDFSAMLQKKNPVADDNIDLFLRQRANKNTLRARILGKQYVADLLDCAWTRPPQDIDQDLFDLQLKLLFAYAVHRIVEDHSPNHIVANTVLGSFYEALEEADAPLFGQINDNAAFSLYIYLHRSGEECAQSIGKTFAGLCHAIESADCAVLGESAYARFFGGCAQRMLAAGFVE